VIADLFPKDRLAFPMAVFSSGATLGQGISLIVGGAIVGWANARGAIHLPMLGELHPWQLVFLITGAPGLLIGLLAFLIYEPKRTKPLVKKARGPSVFTQLAKHPRFYFCHFLGFSILGLVAAGWNNWAPMFLVRTLDWSVPQTGLILGLLAAIGGTMGMLGSGFIADRLFRGGMRDAHLRLYVFAGLVAAAAGVMCGLTTNVIVLCVGIFVIKLATSFIAVAATCLQIVTPPSVRGRISATFLLTYNLVGYALGPLSIASFTQYVFKDPDKIAYSVACHFGIFAPLGSLVLFLGLKSLREASQKSELANAP